MTNRTSRDDSKMKRRKAIDTMDCIFCRGCVCPLRGDSTLISTSALDARLPHDFHLAARAIPCSGKVHAETTLLLSPYLGTKSTTLHYSTLPYSNSSMHAATKKRKIHAFLRFLETEIEKSENSSKKQRHPPVAPPIYFNPESFS